MGKPPKIKPFVNVYIHPVPTGTLDSPSDKTVASEDVFRDSALKRKARREAKVKSEEQYKTGKSNWFFQKLHF
jgi:large subunit ribosomal protein L27e